MFSSSKMRTSFVLKGFSFLAAAPAPPKPKGCCLGTEENGYDGDVEYETARVNTGSACGPLLPLIIGMVEDMAGKVRVVYLIMYNRYDVRWGSCPSSYILVGNSNWRRVLL